MDGWQPESRRLEELGEDLQTVIRQAAHYWFQCATSWRPTDLREQLAHLFTLEPSVANSADNGA